MAQTDLNDLVEPLKRAVATPGTFAAVYTTSTDDDVVGALCDGYWKAKLDDWPLGNSTIDLDTQIVSDGDATTPTVSVLSDSDKALIVLYTAIDWINVYLLNLKTKTSAKAGPVSFDTEQAATVLTSLQKTYDARRQDLLKLKAARTGGINISTTDAYITRALGDAARGYWGVGLVFPNVDFEPFGSWF